MRTLERRRHAPLATVAPMMPQQIRDAIDRGRRHEASIIRWFVIISIAAQVGFGALFLALSQDLYWSLAMVALLTVPLYLMALVWLRHGNVVGAGVITVSVPVGPILAYTAAFSVASSIHITLFVFAVGMFVLIPAEHPRVRLNLALGMFAAFIVAEVAFVPANAWAQLDDDVLGAFAAFNRSATAAGIVVLGVLLHRRMEFSRRILEGAARHGELMATTDELTGLPNRRPVIAQLEEFEADGMSDYAIVLIDIDHFKSVNDEFGHACGDIMIRHVAQHLRAHFRESDMASRWGGDEFLVLMPNIPRRSLVSVLERLRRGVAAMAVPCEDHVHHVTISVGAAHGIAGETADECIAAADHALYRAKYEGRNRVVAVGTADR